MPKIMHRLTCFAKCDTIWDVLIGLLHGFATWHIHFYNAFTGY